MCSEFETITCGDGGMVVTDDEPLYRRCFAIHDQGHSPCRLGIEVARRPFLGLNFRMTELEGAVILAQPRKLDHIRSRLRQNRDIIAEGIRDLASIEFRELPDPAGDLATHLVGMLPTADALLARSMSIGIGVVDPDLAPFGLRVVDDDDVRRCAERFRHVAAPVLGS
jgi:dTDP-4-amino-4,6-dideoxygalactose transaminase